MKDGFIRVAACVPPVFISDPRANAQAIETLARQVSLKGVEIAVFPEMCVTGYTCGDLFHNATLLQEAQKALEKLRKASQSFDTAIVVGAPFREGAALYNAAYVISQGHIYQPTLKTFLPNYNEFYEKRWFTPAARLDAPIYEIGGVHVGIELCEDLWAPVPPSSHLSLRGAEVILNLSASNDLIGKYTYLVDLIRQQSARCLCAYAYASAGMGESSTDLVFDGKALIAENGSLLAANRRWQSGSQYVIADIDVEALRRDRLHLGTFSACAQMHSDNVDNVDISPIRVITADPKIADPLEFRKVPNRPFVPDNHSDLDQRCQEIINIQSAGLAQRLNAIHATKLVVGISGGLDSTLALLVAVHAFDRLGLDRKGIVGITMPGFGTTGRTHANALTLMRELGVSSEEISIAAAVTQHFQDIGQDPQKHDVTYENCQARERTQILMDYANRIGAIVLGTGDLSELALGWATYNGDHMSMYGVNASIPKTLVRHLVHWFELNADSLPLKTALHDIIDTPISPELIPADSDGNIAQRTEDLVGPYELHDFFLYYTLRYGFTPDRIMLLACKAFGVGTDRESYTRPVIEKWMKVFFKRFFAQQFKRSCMPDGPKVGSVCLSPRGDWRMPSDATSAAWLR